jgi:hypothetical protein
LKYSAAVAERKEPVLKKRSPMGKMFVADQVKVKRKAITPIRNGLSGTKGARQRPVAVLK